AGRGGAQRVQPHPLVPVGHGSLGKLVFRGEGPGEADDRALLLVGELLMADEDDALRTMPSSGVVIAGRYLLGERVAQGGMGVIYEAIDQRLARKVAVKMMLDAAAQVSGFAERFEREAKAASSINHPSVVVVHDYGVDERGTYRVLEWVEGKTLAQLVAADGPLDPERAVELIGQVCEGLSAAHAHGIIHRDVKPENVMVVPQ